MKGMVADAAVSPWDVGLAWGIACLVLVVVVCVLAFFYGLVQFVLFIFRVGVPVLREWL